MGEKNFNPLHETSNVERQVMRSEALEQGDLSFEEEVQKLESGAEYLLASDSKKTQEGIIAVANLLKEKGGDPRRISPKVAEALIERNTAVFPLPAMVRAMANILASRH